MIKKIKDWFSKNETEEVEHILPKVEKTAFVLKIDEVEVGELRCENGQWEFSYSDQFKNLHSRDYNHITGFPELDKVYKKDTLWPFFLIRIPGLKQPAIKEIIEKENIDTGNEAALLKRFGHKSISNPYELIAC